jgi:heme/copper-type cytochrome/quinol oxidase subunit 4
VTTLQIVLSVLALLVAVWLVVLIVRDVQPNDYLYAALALLEVGLVVQLVIGLVMVSGDHGGVNVAAYVGYLIGSLVILPVGFLWSLGERTRAGTGVLLVAVLVVPVLFARLHQLWGAR